MPAHRHVFTSESVTEGHPDKIADQISDSILDAILAEDPKARVACETLVTTGMAVVAGEITTSTYVHIPDIVRGTITSIGYTDANFGFDAQTEHYVDMLSAGIVDPAKVVRVALQDAASIAGLMVATEAMVAEAPKKNAAPAMPGGGGMGGMDY